MILKKHGKYYEVKRRAVKVSDLLLPDISQEDYQKLEDLTLGFHEKHGVRKLQRYYIIELYYKSSMHSRYLIWAYLPLGNKDSNRKKRFIFPFEKKNIKRFVFDQEMLEDYNKEIQRRIKSKVPVSTPSKQ